MKFVGNMILSSIAVIFYSCLPALREEAGAPVAVEKKVGTEKTAPHKNPLLYGFNEPIRFGNLQPGDIPEATDRALEDARVILDELTAVKPGARTFDNTLVKLDDIRNAVESVWSPAYLMGSTHPSESIRQEGDSSSIRFERFLNDLAVNEDLYDAVVTYSQSMEAKSLTGYRKKFLEETLRDFRRSGFGLSREKRERVKDIQNRIAELGLEFRRNISSYQDTLFITQDQASGLPEDYLNERRIQDGAYAIDLSYPSYFPFMKFADSDSARKELSYRFLNRAREGNLDILDDIIRERRRLADILGYSSYAAYRTEDRMAANPNTVWKFEQDLEQSLQEKAARDFREMLEMKAQLTGRPATVVYPWEKWYYETKLLETKYRVDQEEVKQYFEVSQATKGLFSITQRLFNLDYREVKNPSVWHPDVRMFEVLDRDTQELLGRFYLDLFPRPNKYQHAAAFSVVMGKRLEEGYQLPAYALVCNFPKPTAEQPSLLPHDDVETFFHEFGHLLHGILTRSPLLSYSGTSVPRDFVEAPSQMLENWVWNEESLSLFARHYETGEVIPENLVDRMLAAKNLNSGTKSLQQVFYGVLDFTLHDGFDPDGEKTTTDIVRELQNEITPYPYQDDTHFQGAFGHLYGYAAAYYGYLWSQVYAQDMFSIFEENGILDPETGFKYRKAILEKGGTEDPLVMVKDFLGREPNNRAFLRSLGLEVTP
ncbi:MAG: M3 family metallopeptidase [Fidelibacterota bacterium]